MNCLDFHRLKLADPRRLPADAMAHAARCPSCAAFSEEVDAADAALEHGLAVPVPDGLADRVLLGTRGRPRRRRELWALAASIALAAAVALGWLAQRPDDAYARLAIRHVEHEPQFLTSVERPDPEAFRTVVENFGGTLVGALGDIRQMKLCPMEDGMGWHVVFETPEGLATLLLVPGKKLDAMQAATSRNWSALARPARLGYYVIVTSSEAATARVDRLVRERVDWKA